MDENWTLPVVNRSVNELPDDALTALAQAAGLAALGELTRGLVHASNNALFGILGQAELMLADEGESRVTEGLQLVQDSALELKETLRSVGALARADERPGPACLDEETRGMLALLRSVDRRLEIDDRYAATQLTVAADTAELAQIVLHVLQCAVSASADAPVEVRVAPDGSSGVLRVRAAGVPGPRPDGGLGLAVAAALARRRGGSLRLEQPDALVLALPLA
jgi:signal transduction histidine kinase